MQVFMRAGLPTSWSAAHGQLIKSATFSPSRVSPWSAVNGTFVEKLNMRVFTAPGIEELCDTFPLNAHGTESPLISSGLLSTSAAPNRFVTAGTPTTRVIAVGATKMPLAWMLTLGDDCGLEGFLTWNWKA